MVWKCQNEISPIFYYGKKLRTTEKLLKIPDIQPPDWKHPYWMTRYFVLSVYLHEYNVSNEDIKWLYTCTCTIEAVAASVAYSRHRVQSFNALQNGG